MPVEGELPAARSLLIAAPASGSGKTTLTLALLRALKNTGLKVVSAKSGPDYIDPKFHEAASGAPCVNLDAWAMDTGTVQALARFRIEGNEMLVAEGAMGLFDGAASGNGSAADLAGTLGIPVILVVDCAKQAQSVAALVLGFRSFRSDIRIAGVVLNRVGSARHETMLRRALASLDVPVIGALPRSEAFILPERHLGLVQAGEHPDLDLFLEEAAKICAERLDLDKLVSLAGTVPGPEGACAPQLPSPLGQRIAIALDNAFSFAYPHLLDHWQREGAELSFFSALADEAPAGDCDAIYLPGGYPELHAGTLAAAGRFKAAVRSAADSGKLVYGECGGYMVLGDGLVDGGGERHAMLGLLPLETSYHKRQRHLGYRVVQPLGGLPWSGTLTAHEFHYASILSEGGADRLFTAEDAEGQVLPDMGLRVGTVMGSFAHLIARIAS